MCLAVPMLIKTIAPGDLATVEIGGVERQVSLLLTPEARVGQYVLVHTGYAINVLDADEAQETLKLLAEIGTLEGDA
jgi:hydrogenase expression/formation protein HypC